MTWYTIPLTCTRCGGPVEHLADGTTNGRVSSAMCKCQTCEAEHLIRVTLERTSAGKALAPHPGRLAALAKGRERSIQVRTGACAPA